VGKWGSVPYLTDNKSKNGSSTGETIHS
jgi:hypothetical protein